MGDKSEDETGNVDLLTPLNMSYLVGDVQDLCRLCMSSKENMVAVSENYPNSDTSISSLFTESLNIDVNNTPSPYMPNNVCGKCLENLYNYSNFRKRSLSIDAKLRQIVCRKQKLAEAQALYGPAFFDSDNSSIAPLCFETNGESKPNNCEPSFQTDVDELLSIEHSNLSSSLYIEKIEASLNEESNIVSDFQAECVEIVEPDTGKRTNEDGEYLNSNQEENKAVIGAEEVCMIFNRIESAVVDNEGGCKVKDQVQSTVESELFCTDVIGEVVVCDSMISDGNASEPDFVHNELPKAVYFPCNDLKNSLKVIKCTVKKKDNCSPMLVPKIFVVDDENTKKHLAFRCSLCRKVFQSQNLFRKHAASHVKTKGSVCKFCDKWFPTRHALIRHERVHSGEKPFKCILCDRFFSQREILQRHILTHTDTKPFQCKVCDKSYAQKSGLINHVKHNHQPSAEISLYPCPLCSKAFCHPSGLSRHMLAHSGKQYPCKLCDIKFSDSSALRRHSKKKHGSLP